MRVLKIIVFTILIITVCPAIVFASANNTQTQAEIIQSVRKDLLISDKKLNTIYGKINLAFSSDKEFTTLLNQDKTRYFQQRISERNLVLPHKPTHYGMNSYEAYLPMYLIDLNNQKINYLKNAVKTYCFYHGNIPNSACNDKSISNIFK